MWEDKTVLITGGTGSLGKALVKRLLQEKVKKLIVYSRDEFKQSQMNHEDPRMRFFLGDVRDLQRLRRAMCDVDYVIHAAALKQVPALEYNPTEAVKTNVNGAINVVEAAIDCKVDKVISISTDKAVNPVNLYGATKLCAEKIFTAANDYAAHKTKFASVRYGNVIGSRGSVIPFFQKLREQNKKFPITDYRMTRFLITLGQAVELVLYALENAGGGEIYVPRIPSATILDIAKAVWEDAEFEEKTIRAGEKLYECLISEDEVNISMVRYVNEKGSTDIRGTHLIEDLRGISFKGRELSYTSEECDYTVKEIRCLIEE